MTINDFPSATMGWVAIATGIAGLLGLTFIILLFTVRQPFGTLNDICNSDGRLERGPGPNVISTIARAIADDIIVIPLGNENLSLSSF